MKVVASKCPSCGSPIVLTDDGKPAACLSCGLQSFMMPDQVVKLIVQRDPTEANTFLKLAKEAYVAGNFNESFGYSNKVLEIDFTNHEGWLYKGLSTAMRGSLSNSNFQELVNCFKKCIEYGGTSLVTSLGHEQLALIADSRAQAWIDHKSKFNSVSGIWEETDNAIIEIMEVLQEVMNQASSVFLAERIYEVSHIYVYQKHCKKYMLEVRARYRTWLEQNSTVFADHAAPKLEAAASTKQAVPDAKNQLRGGVGPRIIDSAGIQIAGQGKVAGGYNPRNWLIWGGLAVIVILGIGYVITTDSGPDPEAVRRQEQINQMKADLEALNETKKTQSSRQTDASADSVGPQSTPILPSPSGAGTNQQSENVSPPSSRAAGVPPPVTVPFDFDHPYAPTPAGTPKPDTAPKVLVQAVANYPNLPLRSLNEAQKEHKVILWVLVDADGRPTTVRYAAGETDYGFPEAARDAVMRSTYAPALRNGRPLAYSVAVEYSFPPKTATTSTASPSSDDQRPRILLQAPLVHPIRAQQMRWETNLDHFVRLKVFVGEQGQALKVSLIEGVSGAYGFDEVAIEAAQKSTYSPATRDGKPVKGWTSEIVYKFPKQP